MITAQRYHDISCGHRVVGHEGKCQYLHGHNYRIHFVCAADDLDTVGRVIDFSVIKEKLCMWLEENWDHKFLAWVDDPVLDAITKACNPDRHEECSVDLDSAINVENSVVWVGFNPTAENMALYLLEEVGPQQLRGTGVRLVKVTIEETMKCSASVTVEDL